MTVLIVVVDCLLSWHILLSVTYRNIKIDSFKMMNAYKLIINTAGKTIFESKCYLNSFVDVVTSLPILKINMFYNI